VRTDLVVMDGIIGMDGTGGPTNGNACEMGVIVAGDNRVEVDSAGIRIMGGDPKKVEHVKLAADRGLGSMDGFEVLGESIRSVSAERDLPRMPKLNKLLITGISLRVWDALREPWARLTGGERVMKEARTRPGHLVMNREICDGCRQCLKACPVDALSYDDLLDCDDEACIRCFCCAEVCTRGALGKQF
jgi:NAD-dependent dihydropyrimidine dehydrogenase PreA subunit